jgi:hypothetical protein
MDEIITGSDDHTIHSEHHEQQSSGDDINLSSNMSVTDVICEEADDVDNGDMSDIDSLSIESDEQSIESNESEDPLIDSTGCHNCHRTDVILQLDYEGRIENRV